VLRRALATAAVLALGTGPGATACTGKREPPAGQEQPAPAAPAETTPGAASEPMGEATGRAAPVAARGAAAGPRAIDAHVHLTTGADDELVAMLDALGVDQAVVLASPHLDIAQTPASLSEYRAANEVVLAAAAAHPGRLIPFVTVELGNVEPEYVQSVLDRGACGVKIYQGHRALRERPLAHAEHRSVLALLEQRGVPVLLHVNTVRYRDDLVELMAAFPALRVVCAHFCGSRTDLDRLTGIMAELPALLFDTSHGGPVHGAAGFANLEQERERLIAMMRAAPERFLFGSDLVTALHLPGWQEDWRVQIQANLDFLRAERFRFWRPAEDGTTVTLQDYRGLALASDRGHDQSLLHGVLRGNAERWLAPCRERAGQAR
jgi:predicted TIM-barrel fold metal-dependent hydrolase